jgi:hypothetical protein
MAFYGNCIKQGFATTTHSRCRCGRVNTRYIVPGAIIRYRQRETPVQLLDSDEGILYERTGIIKFSIDKLEYNITNAIRR